MTYISGQAISAVLPGYLPVGGTVAVGSAANAYPVNLAWDGANLRHILTDTSSGGIVLGSNAVANGQTATSYVNVSTTTPVTTSVKAAAGRITMMQVSNTNTTAVYLKLFNLLTGSITVGTTSCTQNYLIPPNSSVSIWLPDGGLYYSTGICFFFALNLSATDGTAITGNSATVGQTLNITYI